MQTNIDGIELSQITGLLLQDGWHVCEPKSVDISEEVEGESIVRWVEQLRKGRYETEGTYRVIHACPVDSVIATRGEWFNLSQTVPQLPGLPKLVGEPKLVSNAG